MTDASAETIAFFKLTVPDVESAEAFYSAALGMVRTREINEAPYRERMLQSPGAGFTLVLFQWLDGRSLENGNGYGPVGFYTTDMDAAIARIEAAGGKLKSGPHSFGPSSVVFLTSPQGHELELIQLS